MAQNSVAETAIGAVVIAAALGFVVYASSVSGRQAARDSYPLTATFRSVEGIAVGTDVRLAGIRVGAVTGARRSIRRATRRRRPSRCDGGLAIPEDSDVKIASEGLLGGSFVEITPGRVGIHARRRGRGGEHPELGQPAQPADEVRDRANDASGASAVAPSRRR